MSKRYVSNIFIAMALISMFSFELCAQFKVEDALKRLSVQYENTQKNKSVQSLFCLDSTLCAFVDSVRKNLPYNGHGKYWKDEYFQLGLSIGSFSAEFQYSGKYLLEAHKLDPNSFYRPYTLYSEIVGIDDSDGLGWFPSLAVAFEYIREYPRGPRASDVFIIIGDFYKDLFMALRDGKEGADYHYDCLAEYIDSTSISEQRVKAQNNSIYYYQQALNLKPDNADLKVLIQAVKNGTVSAWSTCSD